MRVPLVIVILGAVLGLACGCRSSAAASHAAPGNLATFGTPAEGSIRVKVHGYGVERPGYYFLPRGAKVRDAFKAARGTERADWKRPYSGIVRKNRDGTEEDIWFTRKGRESDENLVLQNGDEVLFSHEVY